MTRTRQCLAYTGGYCTSLWADGTILFVKDAKMIADTEAGIQAFSAMQSLVNEDVCFSAWTKVLTSVLDCCCFLLSVRGLVVVLFSLFVI